jgi:hypothetical protein
MTRIVRVRREIEVGFGRTRALLEPGLYVADDSGTQITMTPSSDAPLAPANAIATTLASAEFAMLLSCRELVYVSW